MTLNYHETRERLLEIGVPADRMLEEEHKYGHDLRGISFEDADLSNLDLRYANLRWADLIGANLRGADLTDANLRGVNLSGADLNGADLSGAGLTDANLIGADLSGADLSEADLSGADLSGADLRYADLRGADLRGAIGPFIYSDSLPCHSATATADQIFIGCVRGDHEDWLENYEEIGRDNDYEDEQIEIYGEWIRDAVETMRQIAGADAE